MDNVAEIEEKRCLPGADHHCRRQIVKIEVSTGEIVDKVSILEIKLEKITNSEKLSNVQCEYDLLKKSMESLGITTDSSDYRELKNINLSIWITEDEIRKKELQRDFGREFVELARKVYFDNDKRASVKRRINLEHNSLIVEEKEYTDYCRDEMND